MNATLNDFKNLLDMQKRIGELNYYVMQILTGLSSEMMTPIMAIEQMENQEKEVLFKKYCEVEDNGDLSRTGNGETIMKDGVDQAEAMKELQELEAKFKKEYDKYLNAEIEFKVK